MYRGPGPGGSKASIFATPQAELLRRHYGAQDVEVDQCMFGHPNRKPTQLLTSAVTTEGLKRMCTHGNTHDKFGGRVAGGGWTSSQTAAYPPEFCRALAVALLAQRLRDLEEGYESRPGLLAKLHVNANGKVKTTVAPEEDLHLDPGAGELS